jgi:hypothetical protein
MKINFNDKLYLNISDDTLQYSDDGQMSLDYTICTYDTDESIEVTHQLKEKIQTCLNSFFTESLADYIKELEH